MTQPSDYPTPGTPRPEPRRKNQRRGGIAAVMMLSLLASAGTRQLATGRREVAIPSHGENSAAASLGSMNSYALGLLLGGLRGPLVMILWTQSENAKGDKNLEGVDTQIEWIRLLQPEFDTVHIFQIWNKAYNISVQMASLGNKYDVILDAMEYARKVDAAKPDDINIVAAIGQLFFDKLGNSSEKGYYRNRVRTETLPHPVESAAKRDTGWRRTQLDPVVDASFNILPELTTPLPGRQRAGNPEGDNGSEIPYLGQFGPYPDGVSPFALAYNYYKRSEVLQTVDKQRHSQLADSVVDSRPALSLKFWAEEEIERGRMREREATNTPYHEGDEDQQSQTAQMTLDTPIKDRHALDMAIVACRHAVAVFAESQVEYVRYINNFPDRELQSQPYIDEMHGEAELLAGDMAFLQAVEATGSDRVSYLESARAHYEKSRQFNLQINLRYYVDAPVVTKLLPSGFSFFRNKGGRSIFDLSLDQADSILRQADQISPPVKRIDNSDRVEFDRFISRAVAREATIAAALAKLKPATGGM